MSCQVTSVKTLKDDPVQMALFIHHILLLNFRFLSFSHTISVFSYSTHCPEKIRNKPDEIYLLHLLSLISNRCDSQICIFCCHLSTQLQDLFKRMKRLVALQGFGEPVGRHLWISLKGFEININQSES